MENWVQNDWAKGRTEYLTFLVKVKDQTIIDRIRDIQSNIAEYQCIEPFPREYLHITVKEIGCFLAQEKKNEDELTKEELYKIISEAREILEKYSPFEARLEKLNNFKSAVVIQAQDGGVTREINGALLDIPGIQKMGYDYPRFLPHVSIAQYQSVEEYEEFIKYLEQNRDIKVGPLKIDTVELVIAHLPVRERFPRLETIEVFKL